MVFLNLKKKKRNNFKKKAICKLWGKGENNF